MTAPVDGQNDIHVLPDVPAVAGFWIQAPADGQGAVVVGGEVDLATAPLVREVAHEALAASASGVHLDLGQVTFFDCAGVGVLIGLREAALCAGGLPLRITASRPVRRLLDLTGVSDLFDLDPLPIGHMTAREA